MAVKEEAKRKWRCMECGYVAEGDAPPDICPRCYATSEAFVEIK